MTAPETARTAEQARAYDAWQDAKRKGVHVHELAAAIAFVRSCLPEPQASKASDANSPEIPDSSSAPAGEAVSVARDVARDWLHAYMMGDSESVKYADARRAMANAVRTALSAPPPSTGDKPCHHCGATLAKDGVCENRDCFYDGRNNGRVPVPPPLPAPTPPPAPASKGDGRPWETSLLKGQAEAWEAVFRRICDTPHLYDHLSETHKSGLSIALAAIDLAAAAPLSVAPARDGFTYPDAAVEKAINRIVAWTKHASLENNLNLHDTPSMLTAARVTPPQQEEDRAWEKECEVRENGVVAYPSTASTTGSVYLVPDGRWLTYDQWLILDPSIDRFPSESAARAALAQAPRPTT